MKRLHLEEIHEQDWCPQLFRDSLTDFLSVIWKTGVYTRAADRMAEMLQRTDRKLVVDLCSGAGGYLPGILKRVREKLPGRPLHAYKTDLYPHRRYFAADSEDVTYWTEPLSAEQAMEKFDALFSMFSALHHFDEPQLARFFETAAKEKRAIAFFDVSQRRWLTDILPNLFLPGLFLAAAPFLRPFLWKRLLFTYLIPAIPLMVMADGFISRMRAYTVPELEALAAPVQERHPDYVFEISRYPLLGGLQKITCVLGRPKVPEA